MALPDLSSRIVYAWPWALQEGVGLENLKPSTPEQSPYIGQVLQNRNVVCRVRLLKDGK